MRRNEREFVNSELKAISQAGCIKQGQLTGDNWLQQRLAEHEG